MHNVRLDYERSPRAKQKHIAIATVQPTMHNVRLDHKQLLRAKQKYIAIATVQLTVYDDVIS